MNDNNKQGVVDGFSDAKGEGHLPDAPDKGQAKGAPKPMSPEEYAKAKKEAETATSKVNEKR